MMPLVLSLDHPETGAAVDAALETGQTLIFPTDTVYGIGGNPWDERTLNHVRRLKERPPEAPFTLHLWNLDAIATYADYDARQAELIEQLLPGPFTLLLPAKSGAPACTVLDGKIGIRVPDHPFFAQTLKRPVFATSVNRHNAPPINDVSEIIESFSSVDLIVTGDVAGVASAILDLTESPARLLRGTLSESVRQLLEQE